MMLNQDQEQVKLLVTFSSDVHLPNLITHLTDNYLFIQQVKPHGKSQLLITFDSMTDLLEIDFVEQFGAISAKVRNSNSFCKEMNQEHHGSTEDGDSSTHLNSCNNIDHFQTQNLPNPPQFKPRNQRLTSLEDVVNEEEDMIKKLALFQQTPSISRIEVEDEEGEGSGGVIEHFEKEEERKEKVSIWAPIVNGMVLTSLLVGGVKALKFFFN